MKRSVETIAALRARFHAEGLDAAELERLQDDPRAGVRRLVQTARRRAASATAELDRLRDLTRFEAAFWERGFLRVAGVDEVGVGTLAGPVVAAAVVLPPGLLLPGVDDSKRLSRRRRRELAEQIRARAVSYALGVCTVTEIDRHHIAVATRIAMRRAVDGLSPAADHVLTDAHRIDALAVGQTPLASGDRRSQSVAAASILAKVERDAMMEGLATAHPGYGFERNRGYGTADHLAALRSLGPCAVHRRSFGPVRDAAVSRAEPVASAAASGSGASRAEVTAPPANVASHLAQMRPLDHAPHRAAGSGDADG